MLIVKKYISPLAKKLIKNDPLVKQAYDEIADSIVRNVSPGQDIFILNNTKKSANGVGPVKERCYELLENTYGWFREKPLHYFHNDAKKGGPIDVYKEFSKNQHIIRVGLEFETGNISSAHRSMNKLCVGLCKNELDIAFLMLPVLDTSYYLTDRVANYEELFPYLEPLLHHYPFVVFGFGAERYDKNAVLLPKGKDGMSLRTIRKWKTKNT